MRLDEDLEAAGPPSLQRRSPHRTAPAPAPILVHRSPEHAGGSDSERHARSPGLCGRSPRFSGDTDWAEHEADSPDPDHQLKRQKFLEARRKHYNLKMSLRECDAVGDGVGRCGPVVASRQVDMSHAWSTCHRRLKRCSTCRHTPAHLAGHTIWWTRTKRKDRRKKVQTEGPLMRNRGSRALSIGQSPARKPRALRGVDRCQLLVP